MRYKKFVIKNFRGIKHAEIDLTTLTGANVFALVGLNESGKTTLLEAIHSFSPDFRSGSITKTGRGSEKERAEGRIPRHELASFTGEVLVEAIVEVDAEDRQEIAQFFWNEYNAKINITDIPDTFSISCADIFKRGDYIDTERRLGFVPNIKAAGRRKFHTPNDEQVSQIWQSVWESVPDIAYYPTFIFDFPERIYLTSRPGVYDYFYRSLFEDILAVDGQGYTLDDICRRIRSEKFQTSWVDFFPKWISGDDRGKVQQIIDRASTAVTRTVFGKWNKIFGEDIKGKELVIDYNVEEGRRYDKDSKQYYSNDKHDIYIWFEIKDGSRRFKVNDRSLGFRWFFAFLLFTQFRVSRKSKRNVLFLFDEPASNLHAAAQQKLIESFPEIANGDNMLMYTTHSHYMIDPAWLEQTFIVTNRSESPADTIVGSAILDDESLDVKAHKYRKFVNDHPSDTSYFQPIVDRLEIVPSKFDYNLPSVVVEGKSDYYILEYASRMMGSDPIRLIPATGSGTFEALISLGVGWGIKFLFLLDADNAGKKELERYAIERGARVDSLTTIGRHLERAKAIEFLIDREAEDIIISELGLDNKPSKKQVRQFFQENLAKKNFIELGSGFRNSASTLLEGLRSELSAL